jgi:hypothetical protein
MLLFLHDSSWTMCRFHAFEMLRRLPSDVVVDYIEQPWPPVAPLSPGWSECGPDRVQNSLGSSCLFSHKVNPVSAHGSMDVVALTMSCHLGLWNIPCPWVISAAQALSRWDDLAWDAEQVDLLMTVCRRLRLDATAPVILPPDVPKVAWRSSDPVSSAATSLLLTRLLEGIYVSPRFCTKT